MIISRLQGGHSNQLFQYAIGRKLADIHKTDLQLDTTWFDDFADVDTPRFYELGDYKLKATTTKLSGITVIDPRQTISQSDKLKRKLGLGNKVWMYYEPSMGFDKEALRQPNNTLLVGFWQTEKYFADLRHELISELELSTPISKKNKSFLDDIKSSESISVHIRRGDYISNKAANVFHGVLELEYYKKAVDYITSKISSDRKPKVQIFVFSNDIEWCKKNIKFKLPYTFIDSNNPGNEDMRLMKNCKHFVMANSSFSWWGSWLSVNPNKIVVAPKVWFKDKKAGGETEIALKSWKLL